MIETPYTGLDDAPDGDHEQSFTVNRLRDALVEHYATTFQLLGSSFTRMEVKDFVYLFAQASYVKNMSGVASRMDHISKNKKALETLTGDLAAIEEARLRSNEAGMSFHAQHAIAALNALRFKFGGRPAGELIQEGITVKAYLNSLF